MRPLEHYLARIRAFPARPIAINAYIECDDYSAWWELTVIYEEPAQPIRGAAPWTDSWIEPREGPYHPWWDRMVREAADLGKPRAQTDLAKDLLGRWREATS